MSWLFLGLICVLFAAVGVVAWRKWIAPWRQIERLVTQVAGNDRPRTFLVDGGAEPRRVGLALESIFARQQELNRQIAGRESGTQIILGAMQDGLLVVDRSLRVTLVNQAFRKWFGLPEVSLGTPLLDIVRDATVDRLIAEMLRTGQAMQSELILTDSKTNSERDVEVSAVPTNDDADITTGAAVRVLRELLDQVAMRSSQDGAQEIKTRRSVAPSYCSVAAAPPSCLNTIPASCVYRLMAMCWVRSR